jgi:predicted RNase H-like nuclease (RuvC/YqgF family)
MAPLPAMHPATATADERLADVSDHDLRTGHRIDLLAQDVRTVQVEVGKVGKGVDELRSAMAVLVKHEVLMNQQQLENATLRKDLSDQDKRLALVEREMPQLLETRGWVTRAGLFVLGIVGLAVVGLVIKLG